MNTSLLHNQRIMQAAAALFQYGRWSEHYIRAVNALDTRERHLVKNATPDQVLEVRAALGVQPWETR